MKNVELLNVYMLGSFEVLRVYCQMKIFVDFNVRRNR